MGLPAQVVKRDGTLRDFSLQKVIAAMRKCAVAAGCENEFTDEVVEQTTACVLNCFDASMRVVGVEVVQDAVEDALRHFVSASMLRHYILYRQSRKEVRSTRDGHYYSIEKIPDDVVTPWGPLGFITFKRTYARSKACGYPGETESFRDTILRVLRACQTQLKLEFTIEELQEYYGYMMKLKGIVSGRFLWQLGTPTVQRYGLLSLQNCGFVKIDGPIRPFAWAFDALMLGTGVGVSVERKNVDKLPPVQVPADGLKIEVMRQDTNDADFIVPDKREGWVWLLERTLHAFFVDGKSFSYSTILVRNKGTPIKGFGGTASGPEDLCQGIENICRILQARQGEKVTSVDCLDIINIIGGIVVAGNIRRSALLAIGDPDDIPYLQAKRWDLGNVPNWRAMSNNSVVCDDPAQLPQEFWDGYEGKGEPYGIINRTLSRECGRTCDGGRYPDPDVDGANPCAEQSLCNYETCCLAEIFLPNIDSLRELERVATMLYRICKHSLQLNCHHPESDDIVHQNYRMGIGITGYLQCSAEKQAWLPHLYEHLRAYDETYSDVRGLPRSIKLTTVKPSGTLSLLAGVTPGVHPGIYKFFIRRIRIASDSQLVRLCRERGYHCEFQVGFDGKMDANTTVVSFPCRYPEGTKLAKDMSAVDQLEEVKRLQDEYSDNCVSCTVYYRLYELPEIKEWLAANFRTNVKCCSFLLHSEHGFKQAPYEEISEEEYERMLASTKPIVDGAIEPAEHDDGGECAGGACPVK